MHRNYRLWVIRLIVFFNALIALVFLLACIAPYLNPERWWYIPILGLGFAILFLLLVLFIFFWLIFQPRYIFISLIPLLLGWKSISVLLALNAPSVFSYTKRAGVIRIASWNVARFVEWKRNNNKGSQTRIKMMDLIKDQNADVLCLQEFYHSTDSVYYDNISYVKNKLGYPYFYYSWDNDGHLQWIGQAIFSRYPIVDSGTIRYPRPGMPEALIHADILIRGDTIRFYTTHLQSVQFKKKDYTSIEKIKNRDDSLVENSMNIFTKLKKAGIYRSRQANMVREVTANTPYPYIITGDFNDVPNSYTYFTIRNGLQDAFLKKGFGIGRTYTGLAPTLRIDHVLTTPDFSVLQFNRLVKDYSDHYMLVADVELTK